MSAPIKQKYCERYTKGATGILCVCGGVMCVLLEGGGSTVPATESLDASSYELEAMFFLAFSKANT